MAKIAHKWEALPQFGTKIVDQVITEAQPVNTRIYFEKVSE